MGERVGILDRARGPAGVADEELLRRSRNGDRSAFAELWRRHAPAGVAAASAMTNLDADDLVAEAFERILRLVLAGRGPAGAFRPYLYTTIRRLAASHGRSRREVAVDYVDDLVDVDVDLADNSAVTALDRSLTAQAFRSLPERWQAVLWYTEVEGLDPHEAAPLLGLNANATAALSFRAREGLRVAWLQAHVNDAQTAGECRWATERLGEHARHKLGARDTERLAFHLAHCAHCSIISEEVHDVGVRLRSVLLPLAVGSGTALLLDNVARAATGAGQAAGSAGAELAADPTIASVAMPESLASLLGTSTVGATAFATKVAAGAIVAVAGATGTVVGTVNVVDTIMSDAVEHQSDAAAAADQNPLDVDSAGVTDSIEEVLPEGIPSPSALPTETEAVDTIIEGIVDTITGAEPPAGHTAPGGIVGADIGVQLTGTATPGAHLSLQTAGQVYATTTVRRDGTFTISATAVPGGLSSLELVQTIDEGYLAGLLPDGGLLGGLVGNLDPLLNELVKPIVLGSNDSRVAIVLVQ